MYKRILFKYLIPLTCLKAFPSLYVIGVRPIGQELLSGPWCKSNHKDWNKPCKGKPHLAPVWECLGSFHF